MSFSGQQTFRAAVLTAAATRQQAKAAAFVTYGYSAAGYATYVTAIGDADAAYQASIATAYAALNEAGGNQGMNGPIAGAGWTPMDAIA